METPDLTHCSGVSIVNFEQVDNGCAHILCLVSFYINRFRHLKLTQRSAAFLEQRLWGPNVSLLTHTAWCWLSIPPENIRKPKGFLMFSEGIDKQYWAVMGWYTQINNWFDEKLFERYKMTKKNYAKNVECRNPKAFTDGKRNNSSSHSVL